MMAAAIFCLVPGLFNGGEGDLAELGLLLCIIFVAAAAALWIGYWKCPYCGKHLDKLVLTQKCKRCGKRIDQY